MSNNNRDLVKKGEWERKGFFLKEFLKSPTQTGSLIPSSSALTSSMFHGLSKNQVDVFVEYGPGSGPFTSYAAREFPHLKQMILFEINESFTKSLKVQFPQATITQKPSELPPSAFPVNADVILSGLPFTNIPLAIGLRTIEEAYALLKPGGSFRTFLYIHTFYLPKNVQLRERLAELFKTVTTRVVSKNIPPAIVIECWKDRVL